MDVKEFKKIDAHAHIGEFGGWAKLENTAEDLIAQMDEYNIEKTLLCAQPNELCLDAVQKYPDRIIGLVYPNPHDGQKAVDMIYLSLLRFWSLLSSLQPIISTPMSW